MEALSPAAAVSYCALSIISRSFWAFRSSIFSWFFSILAEDLTIEFISLSSNFFIILLPLDTACFIFCSSKDIAASSPSATSLFVSVSFLCFKTPNVKKESALTPSTPGNLSLTTLEALNKLAEPP